MTFITGNSAAGLDMQHFKLPDLSKAIPGSNWLKGGPHAFSVEFDGTGLVYTRVGNDITDVTAGTVLHAEIDLRLQPVDGLVEALNHES